MPTFRGQADARPPILPAAEELRAGLAALGPFFALEAHAPGTRPQAPWRLLSVLISSGETLASRIEDVRSSLAAAAGRPSAPIEYRVAASVTQLGLCARLIAPVLGSAVLGYPLSTDTMSARWVPGLGGPFRLSLPDTAFSAASGRAGRAGRAAPRADDELHAPLVRLLDGPIRSLVEVTASSGVSRRLLWGNASSAINGAAVMVATARPELTGAAERVSGEALRLPDLAGSYRGRPVTSFRRQSCCLIYRIAEGTPAGYCGDCILHARPRPGPPAPGPSRRGK
jgi:hypothetical protein